MSKENALWLALALLALGCGRDAPDRYAVRGSVTFAGQPLDHGSIEFSPVEKAQISAAGAVVADGKYEIPRRSGLVAGTYRVRVYSGERLPDKPAASAAEPPLVRVEPPSEHIPAKYNVQTTLVREVKCDSANTFDFDLR